jgi:predicted dehydrogenase
MALAALQNGKHVLTEKPIAITVRQADEMIEAARSNGLKLGVAHQYRTEGPNQAAKKAIEEGRIGTPLRVLWTRNGVRTMGYYNSDHWRGTWKMEGGGVLINQTVHDLDLLCWLVGEPAEVTALVANRGHDTEVEDIACASIRFHNGALASVQLDLVSVPGMASRVIAGDRATIQLDGQPRIGTPIVGTLDFISGNHPPLEKRNEVTWEDLSAPGLGGHAYMVQDFVEAIREDRPPLVPGEQGRRALELVNAILYSGLTGETVRLPLDRGKYDRLMSDLIEGRIKMHRPAS